MAIGALTRHRDLETSELLRQPGADPGHGGGAGRRPPGPPPRHHRRLDRPTPTRRRTCRPRCWPSAPRIVAKGPGGERDDRGQGLLHRLPRVGPGARRAAHRDPGAQDRRAPAWSLPEVQPPGPGLGHRRRGRGPVERPRRASPWSTWARRRCSPRRRRTAWLGGASPAEAAELATAEASPSADLNASVEYRVHLAKVLTRRALESAAG